ncbi:MAG: hypothetical protein JWM75_2267 [Sphingomonas bacterium]|nr:hypothetical protein [Sphingomonas bacterium]
MRLEEARKSAARRQLSVGFAAAIGAFRRRYVKRLIVLKAAPRHAVPMPLLAPSSLKRLVGGAGLASLLCAAVPALAGGSICSDAITIAREARLVTVNGETVVQFKGRGRLSGPLRIAGVPVEAGRGRFWRARISVDAIRGSAAPFARRVAVEASCIGAGTAPITATRQVRLPVGLLGWNTQLASIELGVR